MTPNEWIDQSNWSKIFRQIILKHFGIMFTLGVCRCSVTGRTCTTAALAPHVRHITYSRWKYPIEFNFQECEGACQPAKIGCSFPLLLETQQSCNKTSNALSKITMQTGSTAKGPLDIPRVLQQTAGVSNPLYDGFTDRIWGYCWLKWARASKDTALDYFMWHDKEGGQIQSWEVLARPVMKKKKSAIRMLYTTKLH
jgi:hypothetical protein